MAGRYNIVANQGETFILNFTVDTDGNAWDFTGYTARMKVRSFYADTTVLLSLTTGAGITLNSSGQVSVTVSAGTMSGLPAGKHVYDFEVESSGGIVTRILEGKFTVREEVTY